MLCVLSHQDYEDNKYLFRHVEHAITEDSTLFCYIPSFYSIC
jgi:hypothetical protein